MQFLLCANISVSIIRKIVPAQVRIAAYVVIIAMYVTVADMFLAAMFPPISKALGPYVPLIVVNCIILGRAEAFAGRNNVWKSTLDGIGMGIGFTMSISLISVIREILGTGSLKLFDINLLSIPIEPAMVFILAPGALLLMGLLLGLFAHIRNKKYEKTCCEVRE